MGASATLCERKFTNEKDSRKTLAKHMKDKHRFCDASNLRFVDWMTASNRAWCPSCGCSFSQRMAHVCQTPEAPPAHAIALPAGVTSAPSSVPSVPSSSDEVKVVSATCVIPDLMDILATSIPSVSAMQSCSREGLHHDHEELFCRWHQRARDASVEVAVSFSQVCVADST